jgi:ribA/ribD-fused uncharacterized protein
MADPLVSFREELAFLSNFHPSPLTGRDGRVYPTVEHAYQSAKTADPAWRERIRLAPSPAAAKQLGRQAPIRGDWAGVRVPLMRRILLAKFSQHPALRARLVALTGPIVERNVWHDTFWGCCSCERHRGAGSNVLGLLLMQVRAQLGGEPLPAPPAPPPSPSSRVREVTGDLLNLDPPADALINTVNCVGAMGRGVALAFKLRYPEMYRMYRQACMGGTSSLRPGQVWPWRSPQGQLVLNVAVKDDWRDPARMEWIAEGLDRLADAHRMWGVRSMALPHMGAQNGWLPWEPIRALIHQKLGQAPFDVRLVAYQPGV